MGTIPPLAALRSSYHGSDTDSHFLGTSGMEPDRQDYLYGSNLLHPRAGIYLRQSALRYTLRSHDTRHRRESQAQHQPFGKRHDGHRSNQHRNRSAHQLVWSRRYQIWLSGSGSTLRHHLRRLPSVLLPQDQGGSRSTCRTEAPIKGST